MSFQSKRVERTYEFPIEAPAAEVFPLLCPVREYEWLADWRCDLLYSESGVAEDNCIFATDYPDAGRQVWTVSRYEPPGRIEFVTAGADLATRLDIRLAQNNQRTTLIWTRWFTGLTPKGNEMVDAHDEEWNQRLGGYLERSLVRFLATGEILEETRW